MSNSALILVVDDQELNLRVLSAMLDPLGYRVDLARNGQQGLERVQANPPDLILMDVMMPEMDGFEATRRLKSDPATQHIPVVMVTSLSEVEDRVRAMEAGAEDFLSKPVDKTELRARVRSLLKVKAYHDHMINYQHELEDEVARRTEEVRKAYASIRKVSLDTIMRLSRAAEYKDEDTGTHISRMSSYAVLVARELGLNERTVEAIQYAVPMHDVGKIGIPDHILLKPGPLTPEEWEVMKQHTTIGGRILAGADPGFLRLAEVIALTHHEKWDGTGYPRGLKGKAIPLAGRITAVADVFDALTSDRPYKKAFTRDKALEIVTEGRGGHFDPQVVDAFLAVQDEVVQVMERYRDTPHDHPAHTPREELFGD
jgi:putative two-component system response regulator